MARITRRPLARADLVAIWTYIADESEAAADAMLDRIDVTLRMLSERPHAGRGRPDLADDLRSFPVGGYVLFYRPISGGIELVRVRSHYRDTAPDDVLG